MEYLALSDITLNPSNPRTISQDAFEKLKQSLQEFPEMLEARPVVVNADNVVLGGNMRLKAATELGMTEIPVYRAENWTEEQDRAFIIKDNVGFGEWDFEMLSAEWDTEELEEWGLEVPDDFAGAPEFEASDDEYEEPDDMQVDVTAGDVIEIGRHRLVCGDSTESEQVEKLMNEEKIDIVFTSPPYNQGGTGGTGGYMGNQSRKTKDFYNQIEDNWTKKEYFDFLISILLNISLFCENDSPILWNVMYNANSRDDYGKIVFSESNPFSVKETIIWDKGVGMNICSSGILSRTCELVFLMSKGQKYFTNQNKDTYWNVWRISNKDGENMQWGHGASFPIQLPYEGIKRFSIEKSIVYDPFLGSGTTMVAAHQLNRKCYGMEIDPKYCQVIIDRMHKLDPSLEIKINGEVYTPNDV